jgi:hypothetical protein
MTASLSACKSFSILAIRGLAYGYQPNCACYANHPDSIEAILTAAGFEPDMRNGITALIISPSLELWATRSPVPPYGWPDEATKFCKIHGPITTEVVGAGSFSI